jgi:hypothetical protein
MEVRSYPIPGELSVTNATAFLIAYVSCKTIIELYNFGKLIYKFTDMSIS